ncbi:MAG: hypothetical protein MMC33_007427 [Icmadophila ericetorum]|nr:hypothetical protein [Icmadophila ericetorum]
MTDHSSPRSHISSSTSVTHGTPQSTAARDIEAFDGYPQSTPRSASHSRSSSVWTAPTFAHRHRSRSPSLPPLPPLHLGDSTPPVFASNHRHLRTDSSAYYTAAWGSPYELPSSSRPDISTRRHRTTGSLGAADGSPLPPARRKQVVTGETPDKSTSGELGADSRSPKLPRGGLLKSASEYIVKKPRYGFTEDWLRNHLAERKNTEKTNWLSDDSAGSEIDTVVVDGRQLKDSEKESWLGFGEPTTANQSVKHTRSASAEDLNKRGKASQELPSHGQNRISHRKALPSDTTLRPQDFQNLTARGWVDTAFSMERHIPEMDNLTPVRLKTLGLLDDLNENPLPPPPFNRSISEAPILQVPEVIEAPSETTTSAQRPVPTTSASFQRPKKRVTWNKRTCVIALPLDEEKGQSRRRYLTADEYQSRLSQWESKGYNIHGFDLSEKTPEGDRLVSGQSRNIYPDPLEWYIERENKRFRVNLPDLNSWNAFVDRVREEKLQALGVGFGDEVTASSTTPVPQMLSRQASSQNSQRVFSGPSMPLTSSRTVLSDHSASPVLPGSYNGLPQTSISPQSFQSVSRPGGFHHFPRQSLAYPQEIYGALSKSPQPQPSTLATRSPPVFFNSQPGSRVISPVINGQQLTPRLLSPLQPSNPFEQRRQDDLPQPRASIDPQQRTQWLRALQSNSFNGRVEDDGFPASKYTSQPEIASPVPQGHRYNLSASLQKEIEDAETYIEEHGGKELENTEEPLMSVEFDEPRVAAPTKKAVPGLVDSIHAPNDDLSRASHVPKNDLSQSIYAPKNDLSRSTHASKDGLSSSIHAEKNDFSSSIHNLTTGSSLMSDLDTNPSIANSPMERELLKSSQSSASRGHASKPSMSKFNVNAPEFVFEPRNTANEMFSFLGNSAPSNGLAQGLGSQSQALPKPKLNVAAPTFTPGMPIAPIVPSRQFSFSSSSPTFKATAPEFKPSFAMVRDISTTSNDQSASDQPTPSIFGSINFAELSKPVKNSKAIPIVKPEEPLDDTQHDSEDQDDEFGRIQQAVSRQKRMRRATEDGDEVPMFVSPSHDLPTGLPVQRQLNHCQLDGQDTSIEDHRETTPLEKATDQLKELVEAHSEADMSSSESTIDQAVNAIGEKHRDSFNYEADSINGPILYQILDTKVRIASPTASQPANEEYEGHDAAEIGIVLEESGPPSPLSDLPNDLKHQTINALKSVAKTSQTAGKGDIIADEDLLKSTSSSRSSSRSERPPREEEDYPSSQFSARETRETLEADVPNEMEGRISGVTFIEPSYEELDAVMKHLNGGDSDIGVERIETPQQYRGRDRDRSLIPVSQDMFVPESHLRPALQNRIPSASPNRLTEPFQYLPERNYESAAADAEAELVAQNARFSPSFKSRGYHRLAQDSPVHRLNAAVEAPISDWDDSLDFVDDQKLQLRTGFFDTKVHDLVGGIVKEHLDPLERSLTTMTDAIARLSAGPRLSRVQSGISVEAKNSDADDEDDEVIERPLSKSKSQPKDRKFEKLRDSILEAITVNQQNASSTTAGIDPLEFQKLRETLLEAISNNQQPVLAVNPSELTSLQESLLEAISKIREPTPAVDSSELKNLQESLLEAISGYQKVLPTVDMTEFAKLRESVLEAISAHQPAQAVDLSELNQQLIELKGAIQERQPSPAESLKAESIKKVVEDALARPAENIKKVIEDAIARQMRGKSGVITSSHESATVEKLQLKVAGLESMLKIAEDRAEEESKARRLVEDELADRQRLLLFAQADAAGQREAAEATEASLKTFHDERLQVMQRNAVLEATQEGLQDKIDGMSDKNKALEATLEEYRISHKQWREEMDESKVENQNLKRTIKALKDELEDGIRGRQVLHTKFNRLQEEMTTAARDVARDQSSWRRKDEEHKAKYVMQGERLTSEMQRREKIEADVERLEAQEKEAAKTLFFAEHVKGENTRLETLANELRTESQQQQNVIARLEHDLLDTKEISRANSDREGLRHQDEIGRLERALLDAKKIAQADLDRQSQSHEEEIAHLQRELHNAKEMTKTELERSRVAANADLQAANQQIQIVRADLESTIARLQSQLENANADLVTSKSRYELMLEEASESRKTALRETAEAREAALQEHYRFHEHTLLEMTSQHESAMAGAKSQHEGALAAIKTQHESILAAAKQEKDFELRKVAEQQQLQLRDRLEGMHSAQSQLQFAEEKMKHYQDRVTHLEEKLEIAKSAAQAAVQAVQSAKSSRSPSTHTRPSMSFNRGSDIPEKISPQALRESILVLQEQLHERESRMEELQQEMAKVDKDAPNKIKDRDMEISWLRELLGVRKDDLQDIIATLSQPSYNKDAVKDAAIRLKASLEMEQQEKERAMAGGQTFPSIADITASPRALPLAAAAAWGNWRKTSTFSNLSELVNRSVNATPSRPVSSPQSFVSGLMTPPSTNQRQTPSAPGAGAGANKSTRPVLASSGHRPLAGYSTPRRESRLSRDFDQSVPPITPPLLRKASYDLDAESTHYSLDRYVDEEEESNYGNGNGHAHLPRKVDVTEEDEPFGPSLGV